jgi:hypothetical protein
MTHNYAEQFDLVDRYLSGRLTTDESARFEEHFVDCPECIDRLKTTGDFLQGLRLVTTQDSLQPHGNRAKGEFWSSLRLLPRAPLIMTASLLLMAAIVGAIFIVNEMLRLQSEVDQAKNASAQWERLYEEERGNASLSEKEHQDKERVLTEQLSELEAKRQDEQRQSIGDDRSEGWNQPAINVPIFTLHSARRTGQATSETIDEIRLSRTPANFLLLLALEDETRYKNYRVTIYDDNNQLIIRRGNFMPSLNNHISIVLNSRFYPPGTYYLTVEGIDAGAAPATIGNYPFRVKRP